MQRRRPNPCSEMRSQPLATGDLFGHVRTPVPEPTPALVPPSPLLDDELWSVRTITAKTGLARSTIYAYVKKGVFPRQRRLGPGRVGWRASEVRAWMATLQS